MAHSAIRKHLINEDNDREMFRRAMTKLHEVRQANPEGRFLFWSLAVREWTNQDAGRYVGPEGYRHPIWNLAEVEDEFGESVIPLGDVVTHPLARLLGKDSQLHPTDVGYDLLTRIFDAPDVPVREHLDAVEREHTVPVLEFPRPTLITGSSGWVQTVEAYVKRGLVRLGDGVSVTDEFSKTRPRSATGQELIWISRANKNSAREGGEGIRLEAGFIRAMSNRGYTPRVFVWDGRAYRFFRPGHKFEPHDSRHPLRLEAALQHEVDDVATVLTNPSFPAEDRPLVQPRDVEPDSAVRGVMPTIRGIERLVTLLGGSVRWERLAQPAPVASRG
ncbi:hypothetical protein [Brevibacterium litoralis]|uniref:hypothetical protein n=1 Tax=Brevibacterium litoralis TaxID=3138935 RepID=UPI0032EB911B